MTLGSSSCVSVPVSGEWSVVLLQWCVCCWCAVVRGSTLCRYLVDLLVVDLSRVHVGIPTLEEMYVKM